MSNVAQSEADVEKSFGLAQARYGAIGSNFVRTAFNANAARGTAPKPTPPANIHPYMIIHYAIDHGIVGAYRRQLRSTQTQREYETLGDSDQRRLSMAMAFILDTSVLSETSKSRPDPNVVRFLQEADDLNIPAGVIMEISLGISLICARNPSKAVKLSEWYQRLLNSGLKIINTDTRIAETWGTLLSARDLWSLMFLSAGSERVKGGQDLHIAAAALIHRLPIASLNPKDFLRIHNVFPIPGLYDPRSDIWHVRPISVTDFKPNRVRFTEAL